LELSCANGRACPRPETRQPGDDSSAPAENFVSGITIGWIRFDRCDEGGEVRVDLVRVRELTISATAIEFFDSAAR
jgi:hypothetical protein